MLDPRDQKKGGFGAFAAREKESHDVREAASAKDAQGAAVVPPQGSPGADKASGGAESAADGSADGKSAR